MLKRILLVADAYPPSQSSAATQIRDLALEFNIHCVSTVIVTPEPLLEQAFLLEEIDGIKIIRLKTPVYKNQGKFRRAVSELLMPFFMIHNFKKGGFIYLKWDAVVWYSPTIFLGPFIYYLKKIRPCSGYLILRDIFPAWALDLGILKKGFIFYLFTAFEKFQYAIADYIGVQAYGNLPYFSKLKHRNVQVLQNWLTPCPILKCSVDVSTLFQHDQKVFVYAGNMGIAQDMGALLGLAEALLPRRDIGILLIGWGSDMASLKRDAMRRRLFNVVFHNQIPAAEISSLYSQCDVGLIALDRRHKTHNIPGKFLSYIQSGLPVLAIINDGNDLHSIIERYQVGRVTSDSNPDNLRILAESIVDELVEHPQNINHRCKKLSDELFTTNAAALQIIDSLKNLA